ncbi:hypothetical protein AAF712_008622 [Marasmius tenuissimus]|uniref:Fork-head domain-containing protein n=1 Tax=Marasmius tenuissimus TaxID=585030 RepID=A0ABR2ZUL1_9AGAR
MLPADQYTPQHRQNFIRELHNAPTRSATFTGPAAYSGHHRSSHPATGVAGSPVDNQSRALVLGIDISVAEVDSQLRRLYNIPPNQPVNLYAISDPPDPSFTQIAITQFAIWSSEDKKLTQAQIWSRIEQRFRSVRDPETAKKWKANIRHLLSLKKTFVKLPESRNGAHYWSLDYRYLESGGDKRPRRRGNSKKARSPSDAGRQQRADDDDEESYDTEEPQSDSYSMKEESSSPSPPSSYIGRGSSTHYDRAYGSHTQTPLHLFNPSHTAALSGSYHPPLQQYPSPALHDPNRQSYRHQTSGLARKRWR